MRAHLCTSTHGAERQLMSLGFIGEVVAYRDIPIARTILRVPEWSCARARAPAAADFPRDIWL